MYYRLQDHCKLVTGSARGAIYDFKSGKVHSINKGALEFLRACQNSALEDILDPTTSDNQTFLNFLNQLTTKSLGEFHIFEPLHEPLLPVAETDIPVKLSFLWLEITSLCNNKCLHCYAASGPAVNADNVPHERWLSLISEARLAGATAIQLIGGEPLLYPKWRDLVVKAHDEGYEFIEVFTNGTLIEAEDDCIDFLQKYNVNVATTIYADNKETHDKVTLNHGSFDKTLSAIKKIVAAKLPLRIASIIMNVNEHEVKNIMALCETLGVEVNSPDVVRPTGRGDDQDLMPTTYAKCPIKPPFFTDEQSFYTNQTNHSCLSGKIAITAMGDVIPCIFARNQCCGNIITSSLDEILSGQSLQQCWHTTKDMVKKCKDCEYRYACNDCRPLAQGSDPEKRWLAPSSGCSYNPYSGIWEDENTCPTQAKDQNGKNPQ